VGAKGKDGIDSGLGGIDSRMVEAGGFKGHISLEHRFRVRGEKVFRSFGDHEDFPDALFELLASFVLRFQFFFRSFLRTEH
jgi:hypothetical protein